MMDYQFYPTPRELAERAWKTFEDQDFKKVLEPSAGNGDLADAVECLTNTGRYSRREIKIDCCEIDASKHCILREKNFNVVGLDFLQFGDGAIYSHVILNPPFLEGARHVLKAWDMLWDGEIVAIINAETVRNAFSNERERLVKLIEQYGEVEFIESAFAVDSAERKTEVEIALIHLRKTANIETDIVGNLFAELSNDRTTKDSLAAEFQQDMLPAMPSSSIENAVLAFTAAVRSMRDSAFATARANYYKTLLGETMAVLNAGATVKGDVSVKSVQKALSDGYDELKDRAWTGILRSTDVTRHMSSAAQRRLESEFERIKKLEFTVRNIYGFLCGLVEKQGDIQLEMACDVFDLFTRYHSDNTVFYRGWKSNDLHRKCGMRLRTTRVVLPGHKTDSWSSSMRYESMSMLVDFDKVFAMLDGKRKPEVGLVDVFQNRFNDLRAGDRISSSYFDVRYYLNGNMHLFARDKALVDRLNRLVGRHREWLPPEGERINEAFWLQYDSAEKFDKELRAEVAKKAPRNSWGWDGPLGDLVAKHCDEDRSIKAHKLVDAATAVVLERHGISIDFQLESDKKNILLLEAA